MSKLYESNKNIMGYSFLQSNLDFNLDCNDSSIPFNFNKFSAFSKTNELRESVHTLQTTSNALPFQQHLTGMLMHQMSAREGISKYGEKAMEVLHNEFLQLHDMDVFIPVLREQLTREQIGNTLRAISVAKEKSDGSLKGRTCTDGRK